MDGRHKWMGNNGGQVGKLWSGRSYGRAEDGWVRRLGDSAGQSVNMRRWGNRFPEIGGDGAGNE
jgi:hypothetical protein